MHIENCPIELDLPRHIDEFFKIHRLHDVGICAKQIGFTNIIILSRRRKNHDWNSSDIGMRPDGLAGLPVR